MTARSQRLGIEGEELASKWYVEHGYSVVDRNWRCELGELDVVASRGSSIIFCEVKTRSSALYGRPGEAVTAPKQKRIRRLATRWLAGRERWYDEIRFDVVEVVGTQVNVIEAAF